MKQIIFIDDLACNECGEVPFYTGDAYTLKWRMACRVCGKTTGLWPTQECARLEWEQVTNRK